MATKQSHADAAAALKTDYETRSGWLWFFMISRVGQYSSTIHSNDVAPGDCHALYIKLQAALEGTDHQAVDLAVNILTSLSSAGLSIPKWVQSEILNLGNI